MHDRLLSIGEVSEYLGIPVGSLHLWRTKRTGPPAFRVGKHLKYMQADLVAWVEAERARQTAVAR